MIDLKTVEKGVIAQIKEEGIKEGKKEGIKEGKKEGKKEGIKEGMERIINNLLSKYSLDETSLMLDMSREEIREILNG